MKISIIIPTYNEVDIIGSNIDYIKSAPGNAVCDIIVADGGSTDGTQAVAAKHGAIVVESPIKGRAGQMNHGVQYANGDILYFVHADSKPPLSFQHDIEDAINKGFDCGSYRFQFDKNRTLLKMNAFFTRFNFLFCRGGDQTIFITTALFKKVGGFKNEMLIMEDYDFLRRIRSAGKFKLVPKATIVSARKYDHNSWLTVQKANYTVVKMYKRGCSQHDMIDAYKRLLNYRKNAF
ncbi:TIGR04283 family arsenosugar biosynthesis glycosyltransferase [Ferruginibacter yonginensis]|uniref:TIGR04283 family arsenosugar biosynthesis glycosyltransferase n=1 Tax=Ferruginibacter yonginensis TaxID=1310416 RepID=A0ABV8QQY2_9BACT